LDVTPTLGGDSAIGGYGTDFGSSQARHTPNDLNVLCQSLER
jgi:hypothetical protein